MNFITNCKLIFYCYSNGCRMWKVVGKQQKFSKIPPTSAATRREKQTSSDHLHTWTTGETGGRVWKTTIHGRTWETLPGVSVAPHRSTGKDLCAKYEESGPLTRDDCLGFLSVPVYKVPRPSFKGSDAGIKSSSWLPLNSVLNSICTKLLIVAALLQ
jgi:hypothetical protein